MERRHRPALPRHLPRVAEPRSEAQRPRSKAPDLCPLVERLPGHPAARRRRRRAEPRQRALSAGPGRRSQRPGRPGHHTADALPAPGARQPADLHPFGAPVAQPGLLDHGASIAQRNQHGLTALHLCNDPAVVELFIRRSPDASHVINHQTEPDWKAPRLLDYRARQIIDGSPWDQEAHFAILEKILPRLAEPRLTPETTRSIEPSCRAPARQAACSRLERLLTPPVQASRRKSRSQPD